MAVDGERLRQVCERYGVIRLEVFGSAARGAAHRDSDIDLLYTLAPGARLGWAIEDLGRSIWKSSTPQQATTCRLSSPS